jgi:Xaa-Pro dipeptidase
MRRTIIDRQVAAMTANGYDAFISCSPENYAYATGFVVPSHPLIRHRHAMVIVTADAKVELFSVDMEASTVKRNAPGVPTSIGAEFSDDPMQVLASQLANMGLASGHLGIEFDYLPAGDLARLQAALPRATIKPCEHILARLRQLKTPEEIALLRRLSRIADQAIFDALAAVRAGDSEMDIAGHLTRNV